VRTLLGYTLWLIFLGVVLLSPPTASLAVLPLTLLAIGVLVKPPEVLEVRRTFDKAEVGVGNEVEEIIEVLTGEGVGFIVLRSPLPVGLMGERETFILFKGPEGKKFTVRRRVRANSPGRIEVPECEVLSVNPLFARFSWFVEGSAVLTVAPGRIRRKVRLKARKKIKPYSILGAPTTEFREVREYRPGDPLKAVNWKATARLGRTLVNEFEREGGTTVILVLDVETMERAPAEVLEVVSSLVGYFASREYAVGLYLLGLGKLLAPTTGERALRAVLSEVLNAWNVPPRRGTSEVATVKSLSAKYSAKTVLITSLREGNFGEALKIVAGRGTVVNIPPREPLEMLESLCIASMMSGMVRTVNWGRVSPSKVIAIVGGEVS
jgi:uncharacterized protein (DUF58 family)